MEYDCPYCDYVAYSNVGLKVHLGDCGRKKSKKKWFKWFW